ncbi:MAG: hypothetical protein AAFR60_10970 [Pseudomonadota bacterium]
MVVSAPTLWALAQAMGATVLLIGLWVVIRPARKPSAGVAPERARPAS